MATTLSTAAWAAHDVGLATAIGGTLFGQLALEPALDEVSSPEERDRLSTDAWRRFSWVNLIAHGVVAGSWFIGRGMLNGREVTGTARTLTKVKDGLVIASLVTGVACNIFGRLLGRKTDEGMGPEEMRDRAGGEQAGKRTVALERVVGALGTMNLVSNVAVLGVTSALAMEASKSARFPLWSKRLP
jgi:hypothetical protein